MVTLIQSTNYGSVSGSKTSEIEITGASAEMTNAFKEKLGEVIQISHYLYEGSVRVISVTPEKIRCEVIK